MPVCGSIIYIYTERERQKERKREREREKESCFGIPKPESRLQEDGRAKLGKHAAKPGLLPFRGRILQGVLDLPRGLGLGLGMIWGSRVQGLA